MVGSGLMRQEKQRMNTGYRGKEIKGNKRQVHLSAHLKKVKSKRIIENNKINFRPRSTAGSVGARW